MSTACGVRFDYATRGDLLSGSRDIRGDYREGHYFDRDTLRWFGSRNFATVVPGVSVELQTNAPGDRYKVELWRGTDNGPSPWFGCWHATRREAVACARASRELVLAGRARSVRGVDNATA
jgi:hypothetical protein